MRLSEYSDDELIEELKHRGIKIWINKPTCPTKIKIGGVIFDL